MANIYVKSGGGSIGSGSYRGNWTASQTYALGDRVCGVTTSDYWIFECTTAGTAGGTEPTWTKTDGVTTADGTVTWTARIPDTWADATLSLAKAAANDAAGDNIYVSQAHASSLGATQTIGFAGTAANPVKVICGNDSAAPPTTAETTAVETVTGSFGYNITGSFYIYGITFNASTGGSLPFTAANAEGNAVTFESCNLYTQSTNGAARLSFGSQSANVDSQVTLNKCNYKFAHTGSGLAIYQCKFKHNGGSISTGSAAITAFIASLSGTLVEAIITNFDFSNAAQSLSLVVGGATCGGSVKFIDCKLPASWTGSVVASAPANSGLCVSMYNCDSGSQNYRLWIETYAGSIKSETTLVKTGGASDGTTALSWKLTTNANANEFVAPLITDDMAIWIDATGSSKTITVDILHDSATALTDAEVWLEIDYLGSSAQPLGTPASDKRATVLTTAADQTTSSATWTTTGMTNPNKQKLEVTFTPNMKGFVYARVCLAKASYTIYVDPEPVIS